MHLLTPPGFGGVAVVVAIAAPERERLAQCLRTRSGTPIVPLAGAPPRLLRLVLGGEVRDEVLVVDRGPLGLEVHLHGSPAVVAALAAHMGALEPLSAAPAQLLLRTALSPAQLRLAAEQLALDFDGFAAGLQRLPPTAREAAVRAAQRRGELAAALVSPCRVAIVGSQNAGKSTLFNRLVLHDRALTGEHPGLTRDPVAEITCLSGFPYELVDTAGEGPTASAIDAAALVRGRALPAALRVLAIDGGRGPTASDRAQLATVIAVVATKADLPAAPWPDDVPCDLRLSARDAGDAPRLRTAFGELLRQRRGLPIAGPVGGPAPLDAAQRARLRAIAGD